MMEIDDDDFDDLLSSDDMLDFSSQETHGSLMDDQFCPSEDELLCDMFSDMSDDASFDELDVVDDHEVRTAAMPAYGLAKSRSKVPERKGHETRRKKAGPARSAKADVSFQPAASPREKIEAVFEEISQDLSSGEAEIGVLLNLRPRALRHGGVGLTADGSSKTVRSKRLCFPGKTEDEAWRFTVVIRILELMHGALCAGITISKRDIYYRDPALFGAQRHVDRYVDDIAFTFGVPRSTLNVTAVAKGLVAGAITFCRRDGSTVSAAADREGILVPSLKDILSIDLRAAKWIIVIEKEASFRSLAASSFWTRLSAEGVLITGKGYPDLATRALLRCLCTPLVQNGFASPPCFALVDYDPDGLAIMSVYKHGSIALAHESAELKVAQLRWLGLREEHMSFTADEAHAAQGLLTLSTRDRSKARKMLERAAVQDEEATAELGQMPAALRTMLMLNIKAELQLLDATPDGMAHMVNAELDRLAI